MGVSSIPSLVLVGGLSISISDNYSSKKIPEKDDPSIRTYSLLPDRTPCSVKVSGDELFVDTPKNRSMSLSKILVPSPWFDGQSEAAAFPCPDGSCVRLLAACDRRTCC